MAGNRQPSEIQAWLKNSNVDAADDLTQTALADQSINALVVAASVAIAGGGSIGLAGSGAGSSSENKIANHVKAYFDGSGANGIIADRISLRADDSSSIQAIAIGASLAAGFAGTGGGALSVGVSLANNHISNQVEASIQNARTSVTARIGDIEITASESSTIDTLAVAASLAASGAGTIAASLSGAGADATNVILTKSNAFALGSDLVTQGTGSGDGTGNVELDARDTSTIHATIAAASAAVGVGGKAGVAASIGVSLARNYTGWDLSETHNFDHASTETVNLTTGQRVRVSTGPRAGDIFQYLGSGIANADLSSQDYSHALGLPATSAMRECRGCAATARTE